MQQAHQEGAGHVRRHPVGPLRELPRDVGQAVHGVGKGGGVALQQGHPAQKKFRPYADAGLLPQGGLVPGLVAGDFRRVGIAPMQPAFRLHEFRTARPMSPGQGKVVGAVRLHVRQFTVQPTGLAVEHEEHGHIAEGPGIVQPDHGRLPARQLQRVLHAHAHGRDVVVAGEGLQQPQFAAQVVPLVRRKGFRFHDVGKLREEGPEFLGAVGGQQVEGQRDGGKRIHGLHGPRTVGRNVPDRGYIGHAGHVQQAFALHAGKVERQNALVVTQSVIEDEGVLQVAASGAPVASGKKCVAACCFRQFGKYPACEIQQRAVRIVQARGGVMPKHGVVLQRPPRFLGKARLAQQKRGLLRGKGVKGRKAQQALLPRLVQIVPDHIPQQVIQS
ncbi:hypothetical protein DSECCO2_624740 [anaerobic digester metagenome]